MLFGTTSLQNKNYERTSRGSFNCHMNQKLPFTSSKDTVYLFLFIIVFL
ncbi:unnamed protein product [Nezara viridula]|uniref:Uncharacterized protein n=1 Tax=Nezara viridula TaxID=85310 RepID=A0A9P0E0E5_NEZVI|nr:unnamed protein product [Nezara viridula]